jgi:hypothetical protein
MFSLLEFLFGSQGSIAETDPTKELEKKIQILQNQVNSLQQRVTKLENQKSERSEQEENLNMLSKDQNLRFKSTSDREPIQHTLMQIEEENLANFSQPLAEVEGMESDILSEVYKMAGNEPFQTQQSNIPLTQNGPYVKTSEWRSLGKISEAERK